MPPGHGDGSVEVTEDNVRRLIENEKQMARGKEVFFLFRRQRLGERVPGFPTPDRLKEYDSWFHDVAHGIEYLPVSP